MTWKNLVSVVGGAFLTGAMGVASTHLADGHPSTAGQWEALGIGCLVGGVVALVHLFQPSPNAPVLQPDRQPIPLPIDKGGAS
jgi:hypothetical protein